MILGNLVGNSGNLNGINRSINWSDDRPQCSLRALAITYLVIATISLLVGLGLLVFAIISSFSPLLVVGISFLVLNNILLIIIASFMVQRLSSDKLSLEEISFFGGSYSGALSKISDLERKKNILQNELNALILENKEKREESLSLATQISLLIEDMELVETKWVCKHQELTAAKESVLKEIQALEKKEELLRAFSKKELRDLQLMKESAFKKIEGEIKIREKKLGILDLQLKEKEALLQTKEQQLKEMIDIDLEKKHKKEQQ